MEEENKIPMMLEFLFGEAAETAERGASERLGRWCRAFDEWLAERGRTYGAGVTKQSVLAWRRLLRQRRKMPWELEAADIEQHAAWMQAEGYSPNTIYAAQGIILNFYRWCSERQIDPECEAGFDPGAGVRRPKIQRYGRAKMLSRGEVGALVGMLKRDKSPLGQRDYAFTLARLRLGAPLKALQQLRWGQIEQDGEGAWVRWRAGAERMRLPGDVWEALQASLEAAGRLAGISEKTYVFAPLVDAFKMETGSEAGDWQVGRYLSSSQLLANLKLYGRLAGIPDEKLTLLALRSTATRLRLDEGDSLEEMQVFLDSQAAPKVTKHHLRRLPQLPQEEARCGEEADYAGRLPGRKPTPFKPGEGTTHGFYARSQPPQAVAAVVAENIQGIGEEIVGMRMLARGLLERQGLARNSEEAARLWEAYTLAAYRLGELIKAEKELAERGKEDTWADDFLARLDKIAIDIGEAPGGEQARAEALGSEPGLDAAARRLVEEIAAMRYVLRNVFRRALEAEGGQETVRLVEIYGGGCVRLVRLLRMEKNNQGRLAAHVREQIEKLIVEINEEWGLSRSG